MPKKEKKLLKRFSEIGTFKEKLTPTDRRTDGWTDDGQIVLERSAAKWHSGANKVIV
jgi:hypothetical protein